MEWTYAEYFLGIGAPGKAIKRVVKRHGDRCKFVYGYEIDKYARNAFCAIHDESEDKIYHDITDQPDELPYVDIVFYSPPCTTFSLAGKREGTESDTGNLFYAALQGIIKSRPKYAIMENVANLKKQFTDDFNAMCKALEEEGYINYAKVLNSKDYGIPQNRERIFIVSIRKDLYSTGQRFEFPIKKKLNIRLKDVLDTEIQDKYYLSEKIIKGFLAKKERRPDLGYDFNPTYPPYDVACKCLTARYHKSAASDQYLIEQVGNLNQEGSFGGNPQVGRIYSPEGIAPTLITMQGGGQEPKIIQRARGNNKGGSHNISPTISSNSWQENNVLDDGVKIRKLTPLECFRLQGFDDEDYHKAVAAYDKTWKLGASDSQMYKRAGNSITVQVEEEILENLLYQRKQKGSQISLL